MGLPKRRYPYFSRIGWHLPVFERAEITTGAGGFFQVYVLGIEERNVGDSGVQKSLVYSNSALRNNDGILCGIKHDVHHHLISDIVDYRRLNEQ